MMPSRRGFVIGCGAVAASAVFCGRLGTGEAAPFTNPLPIPRLIDAAASRHSVNLKAMTGRHAFIAGKPTRTTVIRHRSSDLSSACTAAMKWKWSSRIISMPPRRCTGMASWYLATTMAGRSNSFSRASAGVRC